MYMLSKGFYRQAKKKDRELSPYENGNNIMETMN